MADDFGPLVSGVWLAANLDNVQVVDVRWYLDGRSGRQAYAGGHIPGAVFLDIDTDLSALASPEAGRHPLPTPEHFAAALGQVGIADGSQVVAYDDSGGGQAARLWWLLHAIGEPVAVLDGGIAAWPGELTTAVPKATPVERTSHAWPADRFRTADELGGAVLIDARTEARWAQGDPAIDPRPGHIPGAISKPWQENLTADGHFRPVDELRERFTVDGPVVAYCGSGVTACHDLLALELIGRSDTALYPGSFSQWGTDPDRSVEAV